MQFTNTLTVDHPIEDVWHALTDLERVTPCVPGAEVVGRRDDDAYDMALKVKVGPVAMRYRGQVRLVDTDDAARRARLEGRMRETRGQGTVKADVDMSASGSDGRTTMELRTDVSLTGRVASLGQGMLEDVSASVLDAFARNLEAMLAAPEPAPAEPSDERPPATEPQPAAASAGQADVAVSVARRFLTRHAASISAGVGLALLMVAVRSLRRRAA